MNPQDELQIALAEAEDSAEEELLLEMQNFLNGMMYRLLQLDLKHARWQIKLWGIGLPFFLLAYYWAWQGNWWFPIVWQGSFSLIATVFVLRGVRTLRETKVKLRVLSQEGIEA